VLSLCIDKNAWLKEELSRRSGPDVADVRREGSVNNLSEAEYITEE
jgi:hypothetical protein